MPKVRALVVYYSRSGHTRQVAERIAKGLAADLDAIGEPADRTGNLGYLRCALEAIFGVSSEIERPKLDPSAYDLVVVGTPVWYAAVSTPVRTYLWVERDRLPRLAFFLTHGGMGAERVFGQMRGLAGRRPLAELAVRVRDLESGVYEGKADAFAKGLLAHGAAGSRASRPREKGDRESPARKKAR